ncbi:MAG: metal ABC transporter ATP-binding protein [Clostridia bacterium]|nr:metal ABC transporter ATP-binding protein [Clostridia bacterium]
MALIKAENLTLGYGQKTVVEGLSFSLEAGQRILVCGENGSGKSTLVHALCGMHTPMAGTVVYGEGVKDGIGFLPQKAAQTLSFPSTVYECVASGVRRGFWMKKADRERIQTALEHFGILPIAKERFSDLSGGQRQRVLLARAFLCAQHVLVLDEPVTGLDPIITHELYHHLCHVSDGGRGVLFVSHDVSGALEFCTHVLHLCRGGKAHFYTVDEYRESAHFCDLCQEVHHA